MAEGIVANLSPDSDDDDMLMKGMSFAAVQLLIFSWY